MNKKTDNYQIDSDLTLYDSRNLPLSVQVINLAVTETENQIVEFCLTFQVNLETYQYINNHSLFNLNPSVPINPITINFQPEINIQIEAIIKPEFLPLIIQNVNDQTANYLLNCKFPDPLLFTENWLALSVKQFQTSGEVGYSTFWNYFSRLNVSLASNSQAETTANFTQLLQDLINIGFDSAAKEMNPDTLEEIGNLFQELSQYSTQTTSSDVTSHQPIFQAVLNFFQVDGWPFKQVKDDSILQTAFQGKNGEWDCYAQTIDTNYEFVFYSICPIQIPVSKRQTIAEFITRANSNLLLGNFELDFKIGEIRYKTSIAIEENKLSFACIKKLVYTNITMMDKYLPGIISIINNNISPESAINQIEASQEESALDLPSQIDVSPSEIIPERKEHILAILIPEEINQFHQALQVMPHYRRKQAEAIIEKLKQDIITRLGESGEEIFNQAHTFFREVKIVIKNFKLIQRYSGLLQRTKLLLQNLPNTNEQNSEITAADTTARVELDNLFWSINARLQELPTDNLEGRKEVEILMEIEEFRYQLIQFERLMEKNN
ncbi:MAG TPA: YbjN domain-containing protein [Nostocaceae cyanobacterium]|nr:YbjN domain-containing protein [Nostocaceae cyanobacterium]